MADLDNFFKKKDKRKKKKTPGAAGAPAAAAPAAPAASTSAPAGAPAATAPAPEAVPAATDGDWIELEDAKAVVNTGGRTVKELNRYVSGGGVPPRPVVRGFVWLQWGFLVLPCMVPCL